MRQRQCKSLRPSGALRAAAAVAAAAPVLALAPAAQAAPGDTGRPDLVVSELPTTGWEPGTVRHDGVTITNKGTAAADGIVFRVRLTRGLDFPGRTAGCAYTTDRDQVRQALCRLGLTIEPGATATVPVPIEVLPKALMESVEYGTGTTGGIPGEGYTESYHHTAVTADNTADLAAVGDRAKGRPGQTVTVRASLRNEGPGWVQNNVSDDQPALMVKIPEGTTAVRVPSDCLPFAIDGPSGPSQPGKPQYVCLASDNTLEVGSVHTYTFRLRIGRTAQSTSAEVKATSVYDIHPRFDHNAANDTASVTVRVRGHRPGQGSGAGTGATATPDSGAPGSGNPGSGTRTDGAHTGDGAHPVAPAGARTGASLVADSTGGGALAGTGAGSTPLVAGASAGAAGAGGLLLAAGRRRRRNAS
ncbi:hypothetical protein GCM10018793_39270 [Streptomyces sulfonofaciens]|uniref:Gram-positive cocci surface proteins LPxTG domain-containing protein n=1 Tax=Streptomyces sulfonofaciens TaxID=68272 RepID=A0A919GBJ1_9ACTN|nr:hypothetical protein [Streptomyces sulfonofaciens]GHH81578.1 hypothetical protein GCM10018793_39270 [Streptomyces sulfonofaciens]